MTRRHTIQQPHSKPPTEPPRRNNSAVYENVVIRPRPGANNDSIKRSRPVVASQPQQQQTSLLLPGPPKPAIKSETPAANASSAKNEAFLEDLMSFNPPPKIKNDLFSDLEALYKPQPSPNLPPLPPSGGANFQVTQQPQRGFVTAYPQNLFMSPRHASPMPNQLQPGMSKSISWTGNLNGHLPLQHQPSKAAIGGNGSSFSATTSPINQPSIRPLLKSSNSDYSIVSLARKPNGDSLIDLGQDLIRPELITKVSVLEAFDPLLIDQEDEEFAMREAINEDFPDTETIYSGTLMHSVEIHEFLCLSNLSEINFL